MTISATRCDTPCVPRCGTTCSARSPCSREAGVLNADIARAIVSEALNRTFSHPETLAFLTLAIDENWTDTTELTALCDRYEQVRAGTDASIDAWFMLADVRGGRVGIEPRWEFKRQLYAHIHQAAELYDAATRGEGPLDALTPEQQHQLLEDVKQIRAQLGPRAHESWPSLGLNDKGEELTLRDAFGVMKNDVAAIKKKTGA